MQWRASAPPYFSNACWASQPRQLIKATSSPRVIPNASLTSDVQSSVCFPFLAFFGFDLVMVDPVVWEVVVIRLMEGENRATRQLRVGFENARKLEVGQ